MSTHTDGLNRQTGTRAEKIRLQKWYASVSFLLPFFGLESTPICHILPEIAWLAIWQLSRRGSGTTSTRTTSRSRTMRSRMVWV